MKAAVLTGFGDENKLEVRDVPEPELAPDGIKVRVAASSVNPVDYKIQRGEAQAMAPKLPAVLGRDAAGEVIAVGKEVTRFTPGDQVLGIVRGGYAEIVVAPEEDWAKVPAGMDVRDAGALPLVTTTGAQLIDEAVRPHRGQSVLVTGAVGSVGRTAVWAALRSGATVFAGVKHNQLDEARKLGAHQVVDLEDEQAIRQLPELDAVADTVAGPLPAKLAPKVKRGGTWGSVLGEPDAAKHRGLKIRAIRSYPDGARLESLAEAVQRGELVIPISERLGLEAIAQAHRDAQAKPGKVVVLP